MKIADIRKWVKALRSGKYKQGTGALENTPGRYCCLGVACKVFIPDKDKQKDEFGCLVGATMEDQPFAPLWLQDINNDFLLKTGHQLVEVNDDMGFSFNEIADCLEAVYIHKALGKVTKKGETK